jgi:hypothetical protein
VEQEIPEVRSQKAGAYDKPRLKAPTPRTKPHQPHTRRRLDERPHQRTTAGGARRRVSRNQPPAAGLRTVCPSEVNT